MFGGDHYGTVKAHSDRWLAIVRWCRSEQGPGINDARQIDRKVLAYYAAYLRDMVSRGHGFGKENMMLGFSSITCVDAMRLRSITMCERLGCSFEG